VGFITNKLPKNARRTERPALPLRGSLCAGLPFLSVFHYHFHEITWDYYESSSPQAI
jgi:hypothetical protein